MGTSCATGIWASTDSTSANMFALTLHSSLDLSSLWHNDSYPTKAQLRSPELADDFEATWVWAPHSTVTLELMHSLLKPLTRRACSFHLGNSSVWAGWKKVRGWWCFGYLGYFKETVKQLHFAFIKYVIFLFLVKASSLKKHSLWEIDTSFFISAYNIKKVKCNFQKKCRNSYYPLMSSSGINYKYVEFECCAKRV